MNLSLSVGVDLEGNVLLKCFANCEKRRPWSRLCPEMRDLFDNATVPGQRPRGGRGPLYPSGNRGQHINRRTPPHQITTCDLRPAITHRVPRRARG